jgi:hypothetical protein
MRHLIILVVHLITTILRLVRPGGVRAVVAESVLAKHQLLILNRSRRRAPNLRVFDRITARFCSLWIQPNRLSRITNAEGRKSGCLRRSEYSQLVRMKAVCDRVLGHDGIFNRDNHC